jgi:hypothetical protein
MKILLVVFIFLVGCVPTAEEFKAAEKICAEINREARPFALFGEIRCCDNNDCGVNAK